MSFLYPTFLFALAAIAIPIIIHLFNFRRYKKVYFTNVRFLRELKQESDSKSKLKELLILACRILAISALVLAFAQPFIPGANKAATQGSRLVSIYIDNSFSMENVNRQGSVLENAKMRAGEILKAFSVNDRFQLLTNDFEGRHQRLLSKEEFMEQLAEVKISPATRSVAEVIKRQGDLLRQGGSTANKRIFLLSDFQKSAFTIDKHTVDTSIVTSLIPLEAGETANLYIDSCWFETPVQQQGLQQKLHVSVVNTGNKAVENGSLKFFINDAQVSMASFNCGAQGKTDVLIDYRIRIPSTNFCKLKIEDYPVTFDDQFYFSYTPTGNIPCLVINGRESRVAGYWQSLMQHDSLFTYYENSETAIDYSLFRKCNLVVLSELSAYSSGLVTELSKFVSDGGSILVVPALRPDLASYNTFLESLKLPGISGLDTSQTKTGKISFEQGLYEGVFDKVDQQMDLPKIFRHYRFKWQSHSGSQVVLQLQNGEPLLSLNTYNKGKAYLLGAPLDEKAGNFIKHALFVPTIIKIAINSIRPKPLYYHTAANEPIELPNVTPREDQPLHIRELSKTFDVIPEHRIVNNTLVLFTQGQVTRAGSYVVAQDQTVFGGLSFNYDRRESAMAFYTKDELESQVSGLALKNVQVIEPTGKSLTNSVQEINDGKKLWKLFLILTLLFLAAEIAIIRLWK